MSPASPMLRAVLASSMLVACTAEPTGDVPEAGTAEPSVGDESTTTDTTATDVDPDAGTFEWEAVVVGDTSLVGEAAAGTVETLAWTMVGQEFASFIFHNNTEQTVVNLRGDFRFVEGTGRETVGDLRRPLPLHVAAGGYAIGNVALGEQFPTDGSTELVSVELDWDVGVKPDDADLVAPQQLSDLELGHGWVSGTVTNDLDDPIRWPWVTVTCVTDDGNLASNRSIRVADASVPASDAEPFGPGMSAPFRELDLAEGRCGLLIAVGHGQPQQGWIDTRYDTG